MKEALRLARKGLGRTSPNPAVGAVIVRDGRIIARGYHRKAGLPHAEVEALNMLAGHAQGGTLYVTLEPCNHHGSTPPCTWAILKSGLKRVVVGMKDPNPNVRGGGCEFLRENGVSVTTGILERECKRLNEVFLKFVTSGRPFVIIKSALTMDGWTATATGHSKWITNEKSRQFVHRLRDSVDAVMVGVNTVLADNPRLTSRLKRGRGKDPVRVILDTDLRTPLDAQVVNHNSPARTFIAVGYGKVADDRLSAFKDDHKGVSIITCPTKGGRIDLNALMDILARKPLTSILVEGGATVIGSILREKLADKFYLFQSPKVLGGDDGIPMAVGPGAKSIDQCIVLNDTRVRRFGEDILIEGYPEY